MRDEGNFWKAEAYRKAIRINTHGKINNQNIGIDKNRFSNLKRVIESDTRELTLNIIYSNAYYNRRRIYMGQEMRSTVCGDFLQSKHNENKRSFSVH